MSRNIITMENVNKFYGENHVLKNLNLEIREGEFLTLLGPSGCGKTTTLRLISGFEEPTTGGIKIEGESIEKKEAYERNVNTVFQNYVLFPNMNVYDNIAYGLKVKKVPKAEIRERVTAMLELVQLGGFEKRKINQMSGGQKQRVAIARALINQPKVLLLDEPLGALDMKLRKQMQIELRNLQRKLGLTFVFVTHDQEEALTMSDRIAIMNNGVMEQIDTPEEIYEHPSTKFIANFIGESNIFEGIVKKAGEHTVVGFESGNILVEGRKLEENEWVSVCIRPENVLYSIEPVDGFSLKGVVKDYIFAGNLVSMLVQIGNGQEVKLTRTGKKNIIPSGSKVYLHWDLDAAVVLKNKNIVDTDTIRDLGRKNAYEKNEN